MSRENLIQNKIMELEGGAFQRLFDAYLYKKYKFRNIQTLGVQTGTNKPTKGTPDSYVLTEAGKYILINYGSVSAQPADKIKADILSCFNSAKLSLEKEKIEKIICGHCSTNIHIEQFNSMIEAIQGVEIEIIGIDTLSYDLAWRYPHIAQNHLGVQIDTNQFFDIEEFIKVYDANGINASIDCEFMYRTGELKGIYDGFKLKNVIVLTGASGIGKTRLAIEACCKYAKEDRKTYCVRNNGNLLYDDIKYYLDEPGKYLIFLDDANMISSLDNVANVLLNLPEKYDIKILITVRDYAKDRVIETLSQYSLVDVIEIKRFKDDEIKGILKTDLGIVNEDYLNKIAVISHGNIRLAVLAGCRALDGGFIAIQNAEDIFNNYYGRILRDAELTKVDIMILFFIAVAGPVKYATHGLYTELKERYCKDSPDEVTFNKLYSLEFVDWFKNEIITVSDQSFGNYILYYIFFDQKWVGIEEFLSIAFPKYRQKVIYALRTLVEIFNSEPLSDYVQKSIISAWDNAPDDQETFYMESFYTVEPNRALYIIKKHIDDEKEVEFDLKNFDIEKYKSYQIIRTKEIEILGGYKHLKYFSDAVDLLLVYFSKRPDLIMDFYFTITNQIMFDRFSAGEKYKQENILIEKLWKKTDAGGNYESSILYIHVAKYTLKTQFSYTETIGNSKTINFVTMFLECSKEFIDLRKKIWESLAILRNKKEYCRLVNEIFFEIHSDARNESSSKLFLQSDFEAIYSGICNNGRLDFFGAKIIDKYREVAEQMKLPFDVRYHKADENEEFRIYKLLMIHHLIGRSLEDDEVNQRELIKQEIQAYELADYTELFKICSFLEKVVDEGEQWHLRVGVDIIFELLQINPDVYIEVIRKYFDENTPLSLNGRKQVEYLLTNIGYERTYKLISSGAYQDQDRWLYCIWDCMEPEQLNNDIVNDYKCFMMENFKNADVIIPSPKMLNTYGQRNEEIRLFVINKIIAQPVFSRDFLGSIFPDDTVNMLLDIFKNDVDSLARIYMNAYSINDHMDYEGTLFKAIFELWPCIWNNYIDWIKDHTYRDGYDQKKFMLVWESKTWKQCIDYAFNVLIYQEKNLYIEHYAQLILGQVDVAYVISRKKEWIYSELNKVYKDLEKCKRLIHAVVTATPHWKLEILLEFLKLNKNIDAFKALNLFPMGGSYSGSEVPLIIDKIEFLQLLKENMEGVDFIEHRKYIEEYCRKLEKYKDSVELEEYLENIDYS